MKINVGFIFGGSSVEHEISVLSALQAYEAIDKTKYEVVPLYIAKTGQMYTGERLLNTDNYKDTNALLAACTRVMLTRDGQDVWVTADRPGLFQKARITPIQVAFPVVHGTNIEDGTIQGYLNLLGLPYVGSDILSSAVGMDKVLAKRVLQAHGVPVVEWVDFFDDDWHESSAALLDRIASELGSDVVVKPCNSGSSVGVSRARTRADLEEAINAALQYAPHVLVERAVANLREINCSVLGDRHNAETSVCEEPMAADVVLSYADKYMHKNKGAGMKGVRRKLPADLPAETEQQVRALAKEAFQRIGCSGVVRIDFLLDLDRNTLFVNELNTIPGSLSFYLWEATGLPFTGLVDRLIELAFRRHREQTKLISTYNINLLAMLGTKISGNKA